MTIRLKRSNEHLNWPLNSANQYIDGNKEKERNSKRVYQKTKHAKFSEAEHFLPPDTHTYVCVSGGKKCSLVGKFGVLCFLETPVLRFALLPLSLCDNPLSANPTKWSKTLKQFVAKGLSSAQLSKMLLFWLDNLYDLIKSLTYLFIITPIFIILKMQKKYLLFLR